MLNDFITSITWLRSLSAILPLFWRHYIAEYPRLCCEELDCFYDIMVYKTFYREIGSTNGAFLRYFTTKFNIFSPNFLSWLGTPIFYSIYE